MLFPDSLLGEQRIGFWKQRESRQTPLSVKAASFFWRGERIAGVWYNKIRIIAQGFEMRLAHGGFSGFALFILRLSCNREAPNDPTQGDV
ncbi:MAG: hypothetical protein ACU0A2_16215 [Cognatishimia sp.]|uniref:hypothetical protein n=1 Tax=Cognatishimia sp. TaxID=2211648 RepID=UPI004057D5E0